MQIAMTKYPRTPHLEGSNLQAGDDKVRVPYSKLKGRFIVWEEKLDGANSGFSFSSDAELLLQSRGHFLTGGGREVHFDQFKSWTRSIEDQLFDQLGDRYIVFGEWCYALHTVYYDLLPHYHLEFDVYDRQTGLWLSTSARRALLGKLPIHPVPVLFAGVAPAHLRDLTKLVVPSLYKSPRWKESLAETVSRLGLDLGRAQSVTENSNLAEGGYIKIEEGDYVVGRLKYVRGEFVQSILDSDEHWLSRPIIPNQLKYRSLRECPPPSWQALDAPLSRDQFRAVVFSRSEGKCVVCGEPAADAHHIMDRKLFPAHDGGYYADNGAAVCPPHHLDCEEGRISVARIRELSGSRVRILPPGFDPGYNYDKWGTRLAPVVPPTSLPRITP